MAYIISSKTWQKIERSPQCVNNLINRFKFCSWFCHLKEVKNFLIAKPKRKNYVITLGYKHAGCYDIWHN